MVEIGGIGSVGDPEEGDWLGRHRKVRIAKVSKMQVDSSQVRRRSGRDLEVTLCSGAAGLSGSGETGDVLEERKQCGVLCSVVGHRLASSGWKNKEVVQCMGQGAWGVEFMCAEVARDRGGLVVSVWADKAL